jgi:hypothetical protein
MGQLLGFYAGNADAIGAKYANIDEEPEALCDKNIVRAHARRRPFKPSARAGPRG